MHAFKIVIWFSWKHYGGNTETGVWGIMERVYTLKIYLKFKGTFISSLTMPWLVLFMYMIVWYTYTNYVGSWYTYATTATPSSLLDENFE